MQQDIALSGLFGLLLKEGIMYDWETPYGYGGPLTEGEISKITQLIFFEELKDYCYENNIISQFIRFHPILRNYEIMPCAIDYRILRDTIYMDTSDLELIIKNMDTKNRNMVRKAVKNNVKIIKCDIMDLEAFIEMYNETMRKNGADEYYTFDYDYFKSLANLKDNAFVFYAMLDDLPIAGSIVLFNDKYAHYHLSGSRTEYRKYSPSNLLLYEIARWANSCGIKKFHLGGGMNLNDSLFGFKKQFNKNGHLQFVVGKSIFNQEAYNKLLDYRCYLDSSFDRDNSFMIQYRR